MPTQDTQLPGWLQGSAAAQTLARTLLERYPAAFHTAAAAVRPLKIGIDHDIQQALDVAPRVVSEVLRGYTRRRAYRAALAAFLAKAAANGLLAHHDPAAMADFFRALLWGDVLIRVLLGVADVPSINEMERRAGEASRALLAAGGHLPQHKLERGVDGHGLLSLR